MTTPAVPVPLPGPLREARFVERPNRFLLRCRLPDPPATAPMVRERSPTPTPTPGGGAVVDVHMADPGRLSELLLPDRRVWIRYAAAPTRRTDWSAVLVETPDGAGLVSVDTTMPNRLVHEALKDGALEEFGGWELERAEFPLGQSRIDFLLTQTPDSAASLSPRHPPPDSADSADSVDSPDPPAGSVRKLALEVKSVTLVEDGVALFPDAVTSRGARHVRELTEIAGTTAEGGVQWEAAILFVLQRDDAHRIEAARRIDPEFADALADAKAAGVRVLGRRCRVTLDRLELAGPVPVS